MKKIIVIMVILATFFSGRAFCQDREEKWAEMKEKMASSGDLSGRATQHELWTHPVSYPVPTTSSSGGNCYAISYGNTINVDGDNVNIEANQSNSGTVKSECNDMDEQENNY